MPEFTPNLNLIKPFGNENFSVSHANGNADKVDEYAGKMEIEMSFRQKGIGTAIYNEFNPRNHNAFSSVVWSEQRKMYYLSFRGGQTHVEPTGAIYLSNSNDGINWSAPVKIIDTAIDDRDPSLFALPNGNLIIVFFDYEVVSGTANGRLYSTISSNGGLDWSSPSRITAIGVNDDFNRSQMIMLSDGELLFSSYGNGGLLRFYSSVDDGVSWTLKSTLTTSGGLSASEPQLHLRSDGTIICFIRSDSQTYSDIYYSLSTNNGTSFSAPTSTGLKGKSSGVIEKDNYLLLGVRLHRNYEYYGQSVIYKIDKNDFSLLDSFVIDDSYDVDTGYFSFATKDGDSLLFSYHTKLPLSASTVKTVITNFSTFENKKRLVSGDHNLSSHKAPHFLTGDDPSFPVLTTIQYNATGKHYSAVDSRGKEFFNVGIVFNPTTSEANFARFYTPDNGRIYFDGQQYWRSQDGTANGEINSLGNLVWRKNIDVRGSASFYNARVLRKDGDLASGYVATQRLDAGTTSQRPVGVVIGYQYYDTDLKKPIWWSGTEWRDATSTTV